MLALPPRNRWAQGQTAVEHPRAENRPVEPLAVGKVCLFSLHINCCEKETIIVCASERLLQFYNTASFACFQEAPTVAVTMPVWIRP